MVAANVLPRGSLRASGEVPGYAGHFKHEVPQIWLAHAERLDQLLKRGRRFGQPLPLAEPCVVCLERGDPLSLRRLSRLGSDDGGFQLCDLLVRHDKRRGIDRNGCCRRPRPLCHGRVVASA